jgi:hypothetical protein
MARGIHRGPTLILTFGCLTLGVATSLWAATLGLLGCGNACYALSDDWWLRPGSTQWETIINLSLALLGLVLLFGAAIIVGGRSMLALSSVTFIGQAVVLVFLWNLIAQTDRDDFKSTFALLTAAFEATSVAVLILELMVWRRRLHDQGLDSRGSHGP